MEKPINLSPSIGPSLKCTSASASFPGGFPLSFGVILIVMANETVKADAGGTGRTRRWKDWKRRPFAPAPAGASRRPPPVSPKRQPQLALTGEQKDVCERQFVRVRNGQQRRTGAHFRKT